MTTLAAIALALSAASSAPASSDAAPPPRCDLAAGPPTRAQRDAASLAWRYFERNYQPGTGLVSSVDGYPATTMWDLGSTVFATLSARALDLIQPEEFERRISTLLRTLATMPLFEDELPNKSYDAASGAMTDYANRPAPRGLGFSALDVARLVSSLHALTCLHPEHLAEVERVLRRWRTCNLVGDGQLYGASRDASGAVEHHQEGRLGYEQYGARSLALLGFSLDDIQRFDHLAVEEPVEGIPIARDRRDPARFGARTPVLVEPWALHAIEFGLAGVGATQLRRIYDVQRRRWELTGIPTAVSEDHVDTAPWFVYDAIVEGGVAWRTITPEGQEVPALRSLSTKGAFLLATLYPDDPYSRVLLDAIADARDPERGWYAGVYERGGLNRSLNANTNGVILEAVLYQLLGPLHGTCASCGVRWPPGLAAGDSSGRCVSAVGRAATGAPPVASTVEGGGLVTKHELQPSSSLHLGGSLFSSYRQVDGPAAGAVAQWTPFSYFFLRLGGAVTPLWQGGATRALWGFGYDDWHDNTFSIQVNNWGPIQPYASDVGPRGAQLDLSYKVPRLCAGPVCLSTMAFATVPYVGGPYVGARGYLRFWERWFVFGGMGWVIPNVFPGPAGTPRWRPMFGVGEWDWRPGSIFFQYYNWGPDRSWRNGVFSVGMNWSY
ncbi:DUF3131 domain-containing protein [Anaeromyxobacter diazotrophicus]|uniref:DUF3131 domain-containing protein n=1 Tax=Anaeromyxobacter diazotrophicus TaxID=2590199 RepID=A0A7I9VGW1_9BACT|nr:DUF3131 domain-containing protein [Anaeromyxobacter diazotrophicus]GEJ55479.1 hypothetical protein AMYX_02200 [Anaeromyxobacter diazotrophicus]